VKEVTSALKPLLADPDAHVRLAAVRGLVTFEGGGDGSVGIGHLDEPEFKVLAAALDHEDAQVRGDAAWIVRWYVPATRAKQVSGKLAKLLADKSLYVRREAAGALLAGEVEVPKALAALEALALPAK